MILSLAGFSIEEIVFSGTHSAEVDRIVLPSADSSTEEAVFFGIHSVEAAHTVLQFLNCHVA